MKKSLSSHWESVYTSKDVKKLGWYEENPEPSLRLIRKCNPQRSASILNAGSGATTLVDELLKEGYENIIANDLSSKALEKLKARLGKDLSSKVRWIVDDLTRPKELLDIEPIHIWHDRAVLHFFNERSEQDAYFTLLKNKVQWGGFVIIAAFNLKGAIKCSGLPVYRYNQEMLQERLGKRFTLIEAFDYIYTMPSGDSREYVYTLFRRNPE